MNAAPAKRLLFRPERGKVFHVRRPGAAGVSLCGKFNAAGCRHAEVLPDGESVCTKCAILEDEAR
jgi:hypothetical protein